MRKKDNNRKPSANTNSSKNVRENAMASKHLRTAFNEQPTNSIKGRTIPAEGERPKTDFDEEENDMEKRGRSSNDNVI
jgi:hypothetical protein